MSRCTDCQEGQGRTCHCRRPSDRAWLVLLVLYTVAALVLVGIAVRRLFS
jgi:hypothetical protein